MPIKASGLDSSKHCFKFLMPIPGSTRIGTIPALKSAKVNAKKFRLGVTISTAFMPFFMPKAFNENAISSLKEWSVVKSIS